MLREFLYFTFVTTAVLDNVKTPIQPGTSQNKGHGKVKTDYTCKTDITDPEWHFYVNITASKTVTIRDNWNFDVKESETLANKTWFYVKSTFWTFPPEVTLSFSLTYKEGEKPKGNCTWYFSSQANRNDTMTNSAVSTQTFAETTVTMVTTEAEFGTTMDYIELGTFSSNNTSNDTTASADDSCLCSCPCEPKSQKSIKKMMTHIIHDLTIAKNSTYQARAKLVCASDKRWISRGIGCVGVLVLTVVFGSIVAGDLKVFAENTKVALQRLKRI